MTDYYPKRYGNRNPYYEALLKEGTNTSPIGAHSQGMSRLAFALLAGLERGQMDREERQARDMATEALRKRNHSDGRAHQTMSASGSSGSPGAWPHARPRIAYHPNSGEE